MRAFLVANILIALLIAGCGEQKFGGGGSAKPASGTSRDQPRTHAADSKGTTPDVDDGAGGEAANTVDASSVLVRPGDDQLLLECVKQWGATQFTETQLKSYRLYQSDSLGIGNDQIVDSKRTSEPRLVLIKYRSNGLSSLELQLLNPNGFYCLHGDTLGSASVQVIKHCDAEIASDSRRSNGLANVRVEVTGCNVEQASSKLTNVDDPAWINGTY